MMDNPLSGPMSMVKIDGAKIKSLREQQGLTQLYLATAVEVTTDTISRWENRRYPSIKRDNGLKLAEALNVELEALLEDTKDDDPTTDQIDTAALPPEAPTPKKSRLSRSWPLLLLSATLLGIILSFSWYFFKHPTSGPLSAIRVVPAHCISGQPFPVVISVTGAPDIATALIIKESFSENVTILATSPKNAGGLKDDQIKWLKKISNTARYAYLVSIPGKEKEKVQFHGTAALSGEPELPIAGNDSIVIGHHHWADTNKDNVISDDEILTVYDQYSEISELDLDIDLIEEIWMGSKYTWDPGTSSYKIED